MNDLLTEPEDQEARWAEHLEASRLDFEKRVWTAMSFARNKERRRQHYQALRQEMGDQGAREVARLVEGIIKGTSQYPKWFRRLR